MTLMNEARMNKDNAGGEPVRLTALAHGGG